MSHCSCLEGLGLQLHPSLKSQFQNCFFVCKDSLVCGVICGSEEDMASCGQSISPRSANLLVVGFYLLRSAVVNHSPNICKYKINVQIQLTPDYPGWTLTGKSRKIKQNLITKVTETTVKTGKRVIHILNAPPHVLFGNTTRLGLVS